MFDLVKIGRFDGSLTQGVKGFPPPCIMQSYAKDGVMDFGFKNKLFLCVFENANDADATKLR